jgi:hypothetical protein
MSIGEKIGKFMIKDSVDNKMPRWLSFTSTKDIRQSHKFLTRIIFERFLPLLIS